MPPSLPNNASSFNVVPFNEPLFVSLAEFGTYRKETVSFELRYAVLQTALGVAFEDVIVPLIKAASPGLRRSVILFIYRRTFSAIPRRSPSFNFAEALL